MANHGKKVGKFSVSTVLTEYDLDVRLDMEQNVFTILVPRNPGEPVNTKLGRGVNYDSFSGSTLAEVKKDVEAFLAARDVTEFADVIEYNHLGSSKNSSYREVENSVGFDFRVARVSAVKHGDGRPKLEISVDVDDAGHITTADWFGEPCKPQAHNREYDSSIPFTVGRWQRCCAIRDGLAEIGRMLTELFSEGGDGTAGRLDVCRLDALDRAVGGSHPLLLLEEKK